MIAALLAPRRLFVLAALLLLAAVVWWFGAAVVMAAEAPLADPWTRGAVALAPAVLFLLWQVFAYWRARRAQARILRGLVESEALAPPAFAAPDDAAALRENFERALQALRETGAIGRGEGLYGLPWYILIGPPGTGKTTLLRNSGLRFPLAERLGTEKVEGIGGTRLCDWWFTDQAVLIDTAGRFTSQDSDRAADAAAWRGFLDLLRRHRPRQPVNGVIVTLPADRLLAGDEAARDALAAELRARLQEVQRAFGLSLPAYLLVTKCDLLPGFAETHDDLDRAAREQVLGITLPVDTRTEAALAQRLEEGAAAILDRALARLPHRLAEERDLARRGAIFAYPQHLALLLQEVRALVDTLVRSGRTEVRLLPRGVFLTSATQAGTPVDRLLGGLARSLGTAAPPPPPGRGKAYFIHDLLTRLVIPEAALVGRNPRLEARLAVLNTAGYVAALGGFAALALGWTVVDGTVRAELAAIDRQSLDLAAAARRAPPLPELAGEAPLLDSAARLVAATAPGGTLARIARLGLPGVSETDAEADAAYARLLEARLLPALLAEAERAINDALTRRDLARLRQMLTIYLMLGTPDRYQQQAVRAWAIGLIDQRFSLAPRERAALLRHFAALEARMPLIAPLDQRLVATARAELAERPQAERIYDQLRRDVESDPAIPRIDVARAIGPAGAQLILLRAQAGLPVVVPGFFTREGFYRGFLGRLPSLTFARESDDWVVGGVGGDDPAALQRLIDDITARYVRDYAAAWQTVLEQAGLRGFPDLATAVAALQALAAPDSPVVRLVELVRVHTDLAAPAVPGAGGAAAAVADVATRAGVETPLLRLTRLLSAETGDPVPGRRGWPGDRIRAPFGNLIALVDARNGPPPISRMQDLAAAAFAMANGIATAQSPPAAAHAAGQRRLSGQSSDAISNLHALANTLPSPVSRVMSDVTSRTWAQILRLALEQVNLAWVRDVVPVCERAIAGRFPVQVGSEREIPLQDFRAFFGPEGTVSGFVRGNLDGFVAWRGGRYVPVSIDGVSLQIGREALDTLSRARAVQEAYFGAGNFQFRFTLTPRFLDANATRAVLEIDQTRLVHAHDPPRTIEATWPSAGDASVVQVSITGIDGAVRTQRLTGPWALFRVLQRSATVSGRGAESWVLSLTVGGLSVQYGLAGGSVVNPLDMRELQEFRCTPRL